MLVGWDPPTTAVSERALIGQYLLEDFSSPPSSSLERAARSRGGATASEFSFVLESLGADIARLEDDSAEEEHHEEDWPAGEDSYAIMYGSFPKPCARLGSNRRSKSLLARISSLTTSRVL